MTLWIPWAVFGILVFGLLALDLGVLNRRAHAIQFREAALWSSVWIAVSLLFGALVYFWRGPEDALQFFTGYILEKSLSIDNIFVFVVIFSSMAVPTPLQHRVLFWGVLGALIMRGIFIFAGVTIVARFHWVLYLFGLILLTTGIRLLRQKERKIDPDRSRMLRAARKIFPVTEQFEGGAFFLRRNHRWIATPLFIVLLFIETSDVIFAVDSIPAIFAVTQDPFIIYTSNVFAILGLRSLYFLLAGALVKFRHLHAGLALVVMFVGTKMLISHWLKIPTEVALLIIVAVLAVTIASSLRARSHQHEAGLRDVREMRPK